MRSRRHSTPASSCAAQPNASTRSTCSTHAPIAPGTSAHLAYVPTRSRRGGLAAALALDTLPRLGGAAVRCRMRMPCRLLCWAWRGTLKSCDVLCGMARSCPRMMTCGSPCASCASLTHSFLSLLSTSPLTTVSPSFPPPLLQLSAPQVHLDDVGVHPTLTKQPCACTVQ
jgi:hypothetical protein